MFVPGPEEGHMTSGCDTPLPRLQSASHEPMEMTKDYKSGASYTGQMSGTQKYGRGLFVWPDGARYEGEFLANVRQGLGK